MPPETVTTEEEISREEVTPPPETPETPPETPPATPPAAPTAEQVAETNRILQQVLDRTKATVAPVQSEADVRAQIREKTGLSEEGIDWVMRLNRDSVVSAVAPLAEKVAWSELRQAKASTPFPLTPDIEKGMKAELEAYDVGVRGNAVLLEKVYLVEVGKQALRTPAATPAPTQPIVGRRIVTNNPTPGGAAGAGVSPAAKTPTLTDQEKTTARKMGVSEADYAKYKDNPAINGPTAPK